MARPNLIGQNNMPILKEESDDSHPTCTDSKKEVYLKMISDFTTDAIMRYKMQDLTFFSGSCAVGQLTHKCHWKGDERCCSSEVVGFLRRVREYKSELNKVNIVYHTKMTQNELNLSL
jgi:hypothetical protein